MIIPIRCFTCGKVIADLWPKYIELVNKYNKENEQYDKDIDDTELLDKNYTLSDNHSDTPQKKAMDFLQLDRYCCRRHFLCHVDIVKTSYNLD